MHDLIGIDLYCERTGPGFWAEPINAVSNLAFVVAALVAMRLRARRGFGDAWELWVIVLAGSIGIGSFLFHTFASAWAQLADIVPIWSFVLAYALLVIYRVGGKRWVRIALPVFLTLVVVLGARWALSHDDTLAVSPPLNGSLQYLPALLALLGFSAWFWKQGSALRFVFTTASILFLVALFFRTVDFTLCELTGGTGTHFLWHVLDALMIGLLLHTLVLRLPPAAQRIVKPGPQDQDSIARKP